jgi:hypothetical protein
MMAHTSFCLLMRVVIIEEGVPSLIMTFRIYPLDKKNLTQRSPFFRLFRLMGSPPNNLTI